MDEEAMDAMVEDLRNKTHLIRFTHDEAKEVLRALEADYDITPKEKDEPVAVLEGDRWP